PSRQRLRATDDGAWHRPDHLECDGGCDRQRRCIFERPRLRGLARSGAEADVDRRSHDPRQHIKTWYRYRRPLFVQAAWVVLVKIRPDGWERYGLKSWIEAAKQRLHRNVLAIALANKLARIAWAVLHKGRAFECVKINAPRAA